MELNEYQSLANRTDQRPGKDDQALVFPLIGLAAEVGSLTNQYKKRVRDGEAHSLFSDRVAIELGDILWYTSNLAAKLGFSLEEVAALNLQRLAERWPPTMDGDSAAALFDEDFPVDEQLPRSGVVTFEEVQEGGRARVHLRCNGRRLGDPLSDMAWEGDDYRFHDAFHFTYAALLGWSPVVRAFFDAQRDSNARLREIEDSGRAKVIEEAIAALLFEYARVERFLDGVSQIDSSMLETIRNMTGRLEVRVRTTRQWERAILRSFEVWRELRDHRGGKLHFDLVAHAVGVDRS